MRDTEREAERWQKGEAGSLWEPDAGLNPRTPGSRPEPKAGAQPLSHPCVPLLRFMILSTLSYLQMDKPTGHRSPD